MRPEHVWLPEVWRDAGHFPLMQTSLDPSYLTAIDLSACPGGWYGACQHLGINVIVYEWDEAAVDTRKVVGRKTVKGDVPQYEPVAADLLIASPSCQSFSVAGKEKLRPKPSQHRRLRQQKADHRLRSRRTPQPSKKLKMTWMKHSMKSSSTQVIHLASAHGRGLQLLVVESSSSALVWATF